MREKEKKARKEWRARRKEWRKGEEGMGGEEKERRRIKKKMRKGHMIGEEGKKR